MAPAGMPVTGQVRPDLRDIAAVGPPSNEVTPPVELTGEAGGAAVEPADPRISRAVETEKSSPARQPELQQPGRDAPPGGAPAAVTVTPFRRLPFDTRQAMGSLRLDAHVFDADPLRRFVMINGKTLGIGGEVKPGLAVDQIVRHGVVLTWKGQSFILGTGD
jgi:general secretion pathway protein B